MGSVFKPSRQENGKTIKYDHWYFTYKDENGEWQKKKGYKDKEATQQEMKRHEREAERKRAGLAVSSRDHLTKPIEEIFQAYFADTERRGLSRRFRSEIRRKLRHFAAFADWSTLGEVKAEGLVKALNHLKKQGRSPRTLNTYHEVLITFIEWCLAQGWLEESPIKRVKKTPMGPAARKYIRRAFAPDEVDRLCHSTFQWAALVYRAAALSGFRRKEMKYLEKRDCTPLGDQPLWHPRADIVKGKRKDRVPMLPECAALITPLWSALEHPTDRLFPWMPSANKLNRDLKKAEIEKIDNEGRVLDFHSFRYFFCTQLAKTLPIQHVKLLMRHKDIRMTCNLYMDLGIDDLGANGQLPKLLPHVSLIGQAPQVAPPQPPQQHGPQNGQAHKQKNKPTK
jgi:site-specific recombinase XerD